MRERRATVRVACCLATESRLSEGGAPSAGRLTNLSVRGAGFLLSSPLTPGNRLTTRLTLPNDDLPLTLDGVVRWCATSPVKGGSYPVGVELTPLDDTARFRLQSFVSAQTVQADAGGRLGPFIRWWPEGVPTRMVRVSELLLGGLLIAALALWILILQRKNEQLLQALAERTMLVSQLEARQQQLQEQVKQTGLEALDSAAEVQRLKSHTARLEGEVEWLAQNLRDLKEAYARVQLERRHLEQRQVELTQRLTSLPHLRQAMREAIRVRRRQRWEAWRQRAARLRETNRLASQHGNHGYVVYQGRPTLTAGQRLAIHVHAPESSP